MGIGPRKKDNDVRSKQGKIVNPKGGSPTKKQETGSGSDAKSSVKQFTHTGPKYSGPNYPQPDKNVKPFGGK